MCYLILLQTQFELRLSLQQVTSYGLTPADITNQRATVKAIHSATTANADAMVQSWRNRTPEEAHRLLAAPDVQVTNQSDKVAQLAKIKTISSEASHLAMPLLANIVERICLPSVSAQSKGPLADETKYDA